MTAVNVGRHFDVILSVTSPAVCPAPASSVAKTMTDIVGRQ